MLRKALVHWLKRPWTFTFMVMGYVISILIISMSIGEIDNVTLNGKCESLGDIGKRSAIELYSHGDDEFKYNPQEIIKYLGSFGEVSILNMGKVDVVKDNHKKRVEIIPTYYEKTPNWQPPLYRGSYIIPEQCRSGAKQVLIGINIAQTLGVKVGDKISIMGEKYEVEGIIGQAYDWNTYNYIMYISMEALPKEFVNVINKKLINNENHRLEANLLFRIKDEKVSEINNKVNEKFNNNKFTMELGKIPDYQVKYEKILKHRLESKIPLIVVAIINISTMSVFWVMSRRKELTVKKVLGAKDQYIKKSIKVDMLILSLVSAVIAIILQEFLYFVIEPKVIKYGYSFNLNWVNGSISIIIAIIVGYISSIFPAKKTLEITPVEGIRLE